MFKQIKHHEMPTRSFTTRADLRKTVEDGLETYRRRLQAKGDNERRLAASASVLLERPETLKFHRPGLAAHLSLIYKGTLENNPR